MEITMALPHTGKLASPETISRVAEEAERMGCATVWVLGRLLRPAGGSMPDHYATVHDPLETLAYVAAKTERVKLGTSIMDALFHVPATLARRFATLDRLSGGRVIAGLGQGYAPEKFAAANVPMSRRGAGFEEFIRAMASGASAPRNPRGTPPSPAPRSFQGLSAPSDHFRRGRTEEEIRPPGQLHHSGRCLERQAGDDAVEDLVDPADQAQVGRDRPRGVGDEGVAGDQAPEVHPHEACSPRPSVAEVERYPRPLHDVDQLLRHYAVADGGWVYPVEREQPALRPSLRAGGKKAGVRLRGEGLDLGRKIELAPPSGPRHGIVDVAPGG